MWTCRNYKSSSDEYRVRSAWATAAECDRLLLILDAHRQLSRPDPRVIRLVTNFGTSAMPAGIGAIPPAALVLNKVDQVPREQRPALLSLANDLQKLHAFEEVFWVSALRGGPPALKRIALLACMLAGSQISRCAGHGIDELRGYLLEQAVPGVWAVDSEEATDTSEAGVALEVVREKVFRMFYAGELGCCDCLEHSVFAGQGACSLLSIQTAVAMAESPPRGSMQRCRTSCRCPSYRGAS